MEVTDDALRAYVGARADYYLQAWQPLRAGDAAGAGVNKSAFFAGLAWLFYRKLYRPALIVLLVVFIETGISESLFRWCRYDDPPRAYNLLAIFVYPRSSESSATSGTTVSPSAASKGRRAAPRPRRWPASAGRAGSRCWAGSRCSSSC
jgi:hypothetical protein